MNYTFRNVSKSDSLKQSIKGALTNVTSRGHQNDENSIKLSLSVSAICNLELIEKSVLIKPVTVMRRYILDF